MTEQTVRPNRRKRPGALAVAGTALATFLVVLTLLAAQLRSGHDPALGSGTPIAALTQGNHGSKVVTRTSGGGVSAAQPASGPTTPAGPLTTRTSGGGGSGGFGGRESEDD